MILYLASKDNLDLLDSIQQDEVSPVKKFSGEFSLKSFIIRDMRSFSHIKYIVIDHQALNDTDEEIIEAILGFRAMYDARIIYLAVGMKPGERLLENLYEAGVRNFITAENHEMMMQEIIQSISPNGMPIQKIERFKPRPAEEVAKKTKQKKLKAEPDKPTAKKDILPVSKVKVADNKVKSDLENEERKGVTIGVAGIAEETGTTINALNLACFLADLGARVSYIECDPEKSLDWLVRHNVNINVQPIKHKGIHFFTIQDKVNLLDYDFNVLDLGQIFKTTQNTKAFNGSNVRLLTVDYRAYELEDLTKLLERLEKSDLMFLYTSEEDQETIAEMVKDFSHSLYFSEGSPLELFNPKPNRMIWADIMRDYLDEIDIPTTEESAEGENKEIISSRIKNLIEIPKSFKKAASVSKEVITAFSINTELRWKEEKVSSVSQSIEEGPMKALKGLVIWVWAERGRETTYIVSHLSQLIAGSIPVLILDGNFESPCLKRYYPCPESGPGWEASWLKKTPGIAPNIEHTFVNGNLIAWPLLDAVTVEQSEIVDMWNVALYYHRSQQRCLIVDGGDTVPPEDTDINLYIGKRTEGKEDAKTIYITEDMDGDIEGVINLFLQKNEYFKE
ncbi:hypothetical protein [Desulfitobacterium hafniense]|uniref:hypothetical protein n=1 Tax=Desulfitobacterium hafniense TaxID=49338 RepID=UPI000372BD75|nr:hypothetical protein [Desulfitobacterium hafniense]